MDLSISARMDGPFTIVEVSGEVSNSTAHDLRLRLLDLMEFKRKRFIIDVGNASFTDFTGVAALVMAAFKNRELAGTFRLVAKPGPARDFLIRTGFGNHFTIYDDVESAKAVVITPTR